MPPSKGGGVGGSSLEPPNMKGDTVKGSYSSDGAMPPHPLLGFGAAGGLLCPKVAFGGGSPLGWSTGWAL